MSASPAVNTAVVLGARNLGAAITRDLLADGVRVASVARTPEDLDLRARDGALPLRTDASDRAQLDEALHEASQKLGPLELIVDAVSATRPPDDGSGFGGGTLTSATPEGLEGWTVSVLRQAFATLRAGTAALLREGGGTFVEIVGAPARRAAPGRGLIAAASAAVRAMTHAAALELREHGIHVALLIVEGIIDSPKTAQMTQGMAPEQHVRHEDVCQAVRFLSCQTTRGLTHELVITPTGGLWLPS
jgi:NAD(P)-dependent dehydrogenase (short-subunit alcohol dehydrogenase family)